MLPYVPTHCSNKMLYRIPDQYYWYRYSGSCMLTFLWDWPLFGEKKSFGCHFWPNIVAYLPLDRDIYWHSHHIRWNKCIRRLDQKWEDYHSKLRANGGVQWKRDIWLILTAVLWSWGPFHNVTHDMHFAQYILGITKVYFLVCMKDKLCVSASRQLFQKWLQNGQVATM